MSKEGNTEELQQFEPYLGGMFKDRVSHRKNPTGGWVKFSDVQEREARLKARIEELEVIVSGKTMYDGAEASEARWRERIERLVERLHDEPGSQGYWLSKQVRSLLDSGEEQKASEPAIYEGYGRKWERVKGTSALREVGDTGPDWDQCVYHMIGGRVQRFLMAEREARPSPSPALEGREEWRGVSVAGPVGGPTDEDYRLAGYYGSKDQGDTPGCTCASVGLLDGNRHGYGCPYNKTWRLAWARVKEAAEPHDMTGPPAVSQGMVRDGEVVVSREDLRTVLGPRASGTSAAIERRLASDRLRSVLAREGGEE